jgi:hypothetical protein
MTHFALTDKSGTVLPALPTGTDRKQNQSDLVSGGYLFKKTHSYYVIELQGTCMGIGMRIRQMCKAEFELMRPEARGQIYIHMLAAEPWVAPSPIVILQHR